MSIVAFPSLGQLEVSLDSFLNRVVAAKEVDLKEAEANAEMKRAFAALMSINIKEDKGKEEAKLTTSTQKDEALPDYNEDGVSDSVSMEEEEVQQVAEKIPEPPIELIVQQLPPKPSELCECHGLKLGSCANVFTHHCSVCGEQFRPGEIRQNHAYSCHTIVCEDCLHDHLTYMIRNNQLKNVTCCGCGHILLPKEICRRVDAEDVERYHRFLLEKYLAALPQGNLHRCTNPGCDNAVIIDDECARETWQCDNCAATCAFCRQPQHNGTCAAKRRFQSAERKQKVWAAFNLKSKRCPQCRTVIIKNGGCPHMTCRNPQCCHQFCWHCKADWSGHNLCHYQKVGLAVLGPIVAIGAAGTALSVVLLSLLCGPVVSGDTIKKMYKLTKKTCRKVYRELRDL